MSKLISIIIPMFNEKDNISSCLENLYSQSSQDFHVIFVDDGSTDNTVTTLSEQLSDNIPSFSYEILNQENSGAAKARELAVKKSKTTYITLLDCDDKISSNYIELTLEAINNFPNVDILMPNMKIESQNGYIDFPFYSLKKTLTGDECLEHSLGEWRVHGVTCSKKELFLKSYSKYKEYNPSDENYINNDAVITRLNFYYSDKIVRTDAIYYYQNNPESTTKKINSKRYLMCRNAIILKKLFSESSNLSVVKNVNKELISTLWGTAFYALKNKKILPNIQEWKNEIQDTIKAIDKPYLASPKIMLSKIIKIII